MNTRELIIDIATKEITTKEDPANSNMQKYGLWYGMNGVPWCAIFVSWVYDQAKQTLPNINTIHGFHYVPSIYVYAKKNNLITFNPEPGDISIYDWDGDKSADHTGIFKRWINESKTMFEAIEGNTSHSNASNGGEVMLMSRGINHVQAFIKIIK